jgi:hypothetical protein
LHIFSADVNSLKSSAHGDSRLKAARRRGANR